MVGSGVAAATYPVNVAPSRASAHAAPDGSFVVRVNATDIGTGARTVLAQVAADALGVPVDRVRTEVGNSDLPTAPLAGGSSGTASWGWAVHEACTRLAADLADRRGSFPHPGSMPRPTRRAAPTPTAPTRDTPSAHTSPRSVSTR